MTAIPDDQFFGLFLVTALAIWCASIVTVSAWAALAHRRDPWDSEAVRGEVRHG